VTDTRPAAVTYVGLPISSGGAHSLGRMPRRVAYQRTVTFLQTCTEPAGPADYSFRANDVPEMQSVPHLEWELGRRFGQFESIEPERVDAALDFLDEIDPQPTNQYGMAPIWFTAASNFRILDPATGSPLPGQNALRFRGAEYEPGRSLGSSALRLILHTHAAIAIELCIPDADEDVLCRVVPWLQQHLPFKFSPKQWRAWTPTKTGSFKGRKMAAPGSS
jgi:hypothetical protein